LGAVSYRVNAKVDCELAMKRALYIIIRKFGDESKEALLHRGKMLTFGIADAETTAGLSYEEYLEELE